MDKSKIFGGRYCEHTVTDYLNYQKIAIAVQIERGFMDNLTEKEIKDEMKKMFIVDKFNFQISKSEVSDIGANHLEKRIKEGRERKILIRHYYYSIPFTGEERILKFRPKIFHGHDCIAEIIGFKEKTLRTYFECEENNQKEFTHNKSQSIGELSQNAQEANKEIEIWNNNLENVINEIFPIVKQKINETDDFKKRNNIK